jgi:5-methylcytosine-specific restriction endonuclease McrA
MSSIARMIRTSGTNISGRSFGLLTINAVWNKAIPILGKDPNVIRKDTCGAWIERAQYGQTNHLGNGWEIDHIHPVSCNGSDDLANLQPLQWQNNREKGDRFPVVPSQYTAVSARG